MSVTEAGGIRVWQGDYHHYLLLCGGLECLESMIEIRFRAGWNRACQIMLNVERDDMIGRIRR